MLIKPESYALSAHGRPSLFSFDKETGVIHQQVDSPNLIMYSGADILANLVTGDLTYAVNTMYLEFKNGTGMGTITPPVYTRAGGIDYYNGLPGTVDIIRVSIATLPIIESSGANYQSNKVTFFGISEGSVGIINALPFSSGDDSAIYGAALVAARSPSDQTQDLIFSRVYFASKITKQSSMEIGVTWPVQFN